MTQPASWSNWADCLGSVQQRHPALNEFHSFYMAGLRVLAGHTWAVGFHAFSWEQLAHGACPEQLVWDADLDPGIPVMVGNAVPLFQSKLSLSLSLSRHCSDRKEALCRVFFEWFLPISTVACRGLLVLSVSPLAPLADPTLLTLLPVWPSLAIIMHAACAQAGVFGRQGHVLGSAAARVCSPNVMVGTWLPLNHVDGMPLFHSAKVAVDTSLISPLRRNGTLHARCPVEKRCCFDEVPPSERATYPPTLRTSTKLAWLWQWSTILACAGARAFATPGHDGPTQRLMKQLGIVVMRVSLDDAFRFVSVCDHCFQFWCRKKSGQECLHSNVVNREVHAKTFLSGS